MILFNKKTREYIVSYIIISEDLNKRGTGHTIRKEEGKKFNYDDWNKDAAEYWNKKWKTTDISLIITNIFENK